MFTRKEYMNHPCHLIDADPAVRMAIHRKYYAQFVTLRTIKAVRDSIGDDRLLASTDPHLNDIPLAEWDKLTNILPINNCFKDVGDYATLGNLVCIAKEAARQWIESKTNI